MYFYIKIVLCSFTHWYLTLGDPRGLQPARLLCPWRFPGKDTRVGCHFLLQGIFLTQGSNPGLLHLLLWQADSLPLSHQGSPLQGRALPESHWSNQAISKSVCSSIHPSTHVSMCSYRQLSFGHLPNEKWHFNVVLKFIFPYYEWGWNILWDIFITLWFFMLMLDLIYKNSLSIGRLAFS